MQYMLLIYHPEGTELAYGTPEFGAMMEGYRDFTNAVMGAGKMKSGDPLEPVSTATTVRVRNGNTETTDGPFAETKEQLGGFYILDCENLDEAIEYAKKIPTAAWGSIEIRPVMIFD
ncbi:MAG: YciI family protein [Hyphomicrobiales bacterium]